jgi:predicted PurR-regulated permease PerM
MLDEPHNTSDLQQGSFLLILAAVSLMLIVIVWPFATPLLWSGLAAIMFQPLYRSILKRVGTKRPNLAATIALLAIFFVVLAPALWIIAVVAGEALAIIETLRKNPIDLETTFEQAYAMLPAYGKQLVDDNGWGDLSQVQSQLQALLSQSSGYLAQQAVSIGSGAFAFFFSFGLALYVTYFLLRDGEQIGETILQSAPIERSIADRLGEKFIGIVRATIKGSVVVGIVQGALGGIAFVIAGVPSPLLLAVLMAVFSLLPAIGTGLVWAPAGIWLLLSGELWQGVFVLVFGFFIVASADNFLRPILVGRDTGIPDWIILVTTLGGLSLAGLSGIVLGPLVAGLFLASWSILQEQRMKDAEAANAFRLKIDADGKARAPAPAPPGDGAAED